MTQRRILIIKTSSLGDVVHTFPAIQEASAHGYQIDWVVDKSFASVAALMPQVQTVIPISLRAFKQQKSIGHLKTLLKELSQLSQTSYDFVIDAQGLLKSAWIGLWTRGPKQGFAKEALREPLARFFYQNTHAVNPDDHAIDRTRALLAQVLGYQPNPLINYGLTLPAQKPIDKPYVFLLHGTTWTTKSWSLNHWIDLSRQLLKTHQVITTWGSDEEQRVAAAIQAASPGIQVLPKQSIDALVPWLAHANSVIGCDTGLMHLAAAFDTPTISLYGASDPKRTGTRGQYVTHMASQLPCQPCKKRHCQHPDAHDDVIPCMNDLTPLDVFTMWEKQAGRHG